MIITIPKPYEKILEILEGCEKIFVIGCGTCATVLQTGGDMQVKEMARELLDSGKLVTGVAVVEDCCDERLVRLEIRKRQDDFQTADAVLVMACGSGVQTITDASSKWCIPALDTKFLGKIERLGKFYERCGLCGDCILHETGGICPVVRCSKSLLNGPCGGQDGGKCEVGGWQNDCAWVLIYNRLKELGKLDLMRKFRPPKDYSSLSKYKELVQEATT